MKKIESFKKLKKFKYDHTGCKRLIAIGDIHGQNDLLVKLMKSIKFNIDEDFLIFMGDYIDRGRETEDEALVVDYLINLHNKSKGKVLLLKGNHEIMVETVLPLAEEQGMYAIEQKSWWGRNGAGDKCKWSKTRRISLIEFCNVLPLYYQTETHFFVHAGIKQGIPIAQQREEDMFWNRSGNQKRYNGKQLVVGHTPDEDVIINDNKICVDTGAFCYGKLSAYDIINEKVYFVKRK